MKQSQAIAIVNQLLLSIQKTKSNLTDPAIGLVNDRTPRYDPIRQILVDMFPIAADPQQFTLQAVIQIATQVDRTGELAPIDFYNLMSLVQRDLAVQYHAVVYGTDPFPAPDLSWVANGWTAEER